MTRNLLLPFLALTFTSNLFGQNPLVKQWDYRYGGTDREWLTNFQKTHDSGSILSGFSNSDSSGDKTQHSWGGSDYWIIKLDSMGIKQWEKRFGGNNDDELYDLKSTNDGGYIMGGGSGSGVSGDRTQPNWDSTGNSYDYWIVRIDSSGNYQWDKRFGGASDDILYTLQQTSDGGFILGGESYSDSSGDKTQNGIDTSSIWYHRGNCWIVKIDSIGNKQWDKQFGGSGDDDLRSIKITSDGGYILGGYSSSDIGGDVSQQTRGGYDFWIIKIDSLGNKQWDKRFGGTNDDVLYSLEITNDMKFILAGDSKSDSGGDKTTATWGDNDFWIMKVDSTGIKQWEKDFGGTIREEFQSIFQTLDNGFVISGDSYSAISGDKTENNLGMEQAWIIKTDSLGNKQWDKTVFTNGHDESGYIVQTNYNCYDVANYSDAGIGGYKSQTNWGNSDYWIVKFCDTTTTVGVYSPNTFPTISIYPNPFNYVISISIQKQDLKKAVFIIKNILGQPLFNKQEINLNSSYTKTLDLNFLSKGIYLLDLNIDGERIVRKILKE